MVNKQDIGIGAIFYYPAFKRNVVVLEIKSINAFDYEEPIIKWIFETNKPSSAHYLTVETACIYWENLLEIKKELFG